MRKFTWRGKTMEELEVMDTKEFAKLLTSRERRSLTRGLPMPQKKLLERIRKDKKKLARTKSREMIITPELVGATIGVHNGKEYVKIEIKPEMLGKRLGEFAPTRKIIKHSSPGFGATKSSKFVPLK